MIKNYLIMVCGFLLFLCLACGANGGKATSKQTKESAIIKAPEFNADSAYSYIKDQVDFGYRVPNTKEHVACGDFLANKLAAHGATVINQYATLTAYDGTPLKARNIIGSYNPEMKKRVVLFAHWDTRPWADNDKDETKHHTPILGANDGASGVGVLLEIARQLGKQQQPTIGIDLIFFDAEDYGTPQFYEGEHTEESWCLGSQYWARFPHVQGYNARFGILLDMVGGKGATFLQEGYSNEFAKSIVKKVWNKANDIGYGTYFINRKGGYVTDDHLFVNRIAKIPTIDIIPTDETDEQSSFGSFWHTENDTMDVIDKATLKAVGQTVMEVIYNEK
ncbi:MAG: M28 family peptidase [Bacteroides sp.]